jgi:serine phosphatase RsbU (regulator of sigma subunit)
MGIERTFRLYNDLESFKVKAEQEIKLARHMFDSVTRRRRQDLGELSSWVWAAGHFSGDMLIYEKNISGKLYLMLGDFTGHGLAAAVGVIPTSDTFFSLAERGCEVGEIAAEINRKLYNMLPTGHFCAACIAEVDFEQALVHVWNGGLPPPMMAAEEGKPLSRLASLNLPLGILAPHDFVPQVETVAPSIRSSMVFYSDGLVEAVNSQGEMFGEQRLEAALERYSGSASLLNTIKKTVISFMDGLDPVDDITLLTLRLE